MDLRLSGNNSIVLVAMLSATLFAATSTCAQTTGFTYQGRLTDGGTVANGTYDLQFALWDSLSGGTQVGSTQTLNTVAVSNGIFTVSLDFGANSFPGPNRFLEISARPSGAGVFTLLTPRQAVTSTPYAVRSASSGNADTATNATNAATATNATQLGGVAAGLYVQTNDSRLSDARSPTAGSGNYIQNASAGQTGNFNITGDGTVGSTLTGKLVNTSTQYLIGFVRAMGAPCCNSNFFAGLFAGNIDLSMMTGGGNSFFGDFAGAVDTTGQFDAFLGYRSGQLNTTGSNNTFVGSDAGTLNTDGSGNTFVGVSAGAANTTGIRNTIVGAGATFGSANLSNATAIGHNAEVDQSNSLVLGSIGGVNGGIDTNVGIGTTAPVFRLHVVDHSNTGLRVQTNTGGGTIASFGGNGDFQIDAVNVTGGRFIVQQGGNVGIGTASPDSKLTVNGTADKLGGGSWATFSDERLKNIKGRFTPGLKAVMQLQPLHYEYKHDNALNLQSDGEYVGFSAQAVQLIIPEAVSKNQQGYLLVNNDPILWAMLNAIKEQEKEIRDQRLTNEQQQARIKQQQAELTRQQQELSALKKLVCRAHSQALLCK